VNGFSGRLRWGDDRLRREVEWNPQHVRILHVEKALLIEIVGLAPERAANYLLAEKLRAEGSHP
jgi:hypothetical protein